MLSSASIKEFKKLYYQEYKILLTDKQAVDLGSKLIRLVKAVYGPAIPKKWIYISKTDKLNK